MPPLHRTPGPARISPIDAHTRSLTGEAVLLDVREPAEYAAGHAPGSVPLPLSLLAANAPVPRDLDGRPVLCVCRSGRRSQRAAEILTARGITALNVTGGMQAWAQAGLPVRTSHGHHGHTE
ncbi:rhodanese-like domain-containing protein [Streptomyces sp. NPDC001880]